jgi:hypothetical protein
LLEAISASQITSGFDCGKPPLNTWLMLRALSNHQKGFTSVVVLPVNTVVKGYYGLAPTAVAPQLLPRAIRTGQPPAPLPCILLGRLAIDISMKGKGLSNVLLLHAMQRSQEAARLIGGRAVIVHALDEDAAGYWAGRGFHATEEDPLVLFMGMPELEKTLSRLQN